MRNVIISIISLVVFSLLIGCQTTSSTSTTLAAKEPGADVLPNPWAGCAKGSFVHYKVIRPVDGGAVEQKQVAVDATAEQVLIETYTLVNNEWRSEGVLDFPLAALSKPPAGQVKYSDQTLKINDKTLNCKVSEREVQIGEARTVIRNWMCRDIPGGFARKEMAGQTVWEVLDFAKK